MVEATYRQSGDPVGEREGSPRAARVDVCSRPGSARRVLMLCYYYPPISSAGTHRSVGFARWLRQFGWRPVVLTVHRSRTRWELSGEQVPTDIEVVRSSEWDLQGVLTLVSGVVNRMCDLLGLRRLPGPFFYAWCLPDPQIAWLSTLRGILLARRCQSVYASCSPFSSAISGCLIKLATGTPLVLDFRDPWALNPHANRSPMQKRVLSWLEKWVVGACNVLILNTPGAERLYRATYPADAHKMTCIPNGLDQINMPLARGGGERFVIMHVGEFYRSRKPDRLLEALVSIGNPNIEFVQVGPVFESYAHFKDQLPIRVINGVPHARALELMREASMLYLCQGWEPDVSVYVQVASKTYEYLATGLPILAECPAGDNADLIRRYANRAWVVTPPSVEDLRQSVTEAYALRDQHSADMNPAFLRTFDRRRLTGELAVVLDSAADGAVDYSASRLVRPIQLGQAPETMVD